MARSLNKKYFGNRNIGTNGAEITGNNSNNQNYADDRIGGEGVASYGSIQAGNGWTTDPDVYFSDPSIPGGVRVAGIAHYKALSFATTVNGTGYNLGDVLEVDTGTASTKAKAPVSALTVVGITLKNGGTANDVGDIFAFNNPKFATAMRVRVTASSGGVATAVEIVDGGRLVTGPLPGDTDEAGFARVQTFGTTDTNGQGLQVNFTAWGVYSFGAVSTPGDYTGFPSTGGAGTLAAVTGSGSGAKADITMGLLSIAITQRGSGYINPDDAELLFDNGANGASAVAVLTTDTGAVGSATNQENAIIIYANLVGGSGGEMSDIIKQSSARRYKVRTPGYTGICKLVADSNPSINEAYIQATDDNGNTYFVTKITAHKATLTRWNQNMQEDWLFATGEAIKWTFGSTTANTVQIENA